MNELYILIIMLLHIRHEDMDAKFPEFNLHLIFCECNSTHVITRQTVCAANIITYGLNTILHLLLLQTKPASNKATLQAIPTQ